MINKEIIEAFVAIAREKNIDRTNLGTIIEELFMSLIHKKYGEDRENFSVIVKITPRIVFSAQLSDRPALLSVVFYLAPLCRK